MTRIPKLSYILLYHGKMARFLDIEVHRPAYLP